MEPPRGWAAWRSYAWGCADTVYAWVSSAGRSWTCGSERRKKNMFFSGGWGDLEAYAAQERGLMRHWAEHGGDWPLEGRGPVSWRAVGGREGDVWMDEGLVRSPVAEAAGLPEEGGCATLRFLFVRARPGGTELPQTRAVCLHMAATGATDYEARTNAVALPLLEKGVASVIMMPAWYGSRAPPSQTHCYVETVADYLRQTLSVVTEGGAILRWLSDGFRVSAEEQYAEGQLAVACSGFSWGGAMCAVAAVLSERKVAAVPCCGSVSPECMVSNRTAVVQPHERQKFISRVRR